MRRNQGMCRSIGVVGCMIAVIATAACATDDPADPATVSSSASEAVAPSSTSPSASIEAADAGPSTSKPAAGTVDIRDFAGSSSGGDGYFFQSPSGNVKCGLKITSDPTIPPGCMAEKSVQSNTGVTCANDIGSFYLLVLENGEAISKCEGPGTPHADNAQNEAGMAGGRVLQTGEIISYNGVTCVSNNNEIDCRLDGTNRGFELSDTVNDTRRY